MDKNLRGNICPYAFLFFALVAPWVAMRASAETKYSAGEVQNRMSQIYYWHLAEELKISADQEKDMVRILEDSQKRRTELLGLRENHLKALKSQKGGLTKVLTDYESVTHDLALVDREEFHALRKLFGDQTLARFLVERDQITERLRNSIRKAPASTTSR